MAVFQVGTKEPLNTRHSVLHQPQMIPMSRDLGCNLAPQELLRLTDFENLKNQAAVADHLHRGLSATDSANLKLLQSHHQEYIEDVRRDTELKQRKNLDRASLNHISRHSPKLHRRHSSSGSRDLHGHSSGSRMSDGRMQESALPDYKCDSLYGGTSAGIVKGNEKIVFPSQSLYNGLTDQAFTNSGTSRYPYGDSRLMSTAVPIPSLVASNTTAANRSLKTLDSPALSQLLLDQQVVTMLQMQQLRQLQQSYLSCGTTPFLLPENAVASDLEMVWRLKNPGFPLLPTWMLPWFQEQVAQRTGVNLRDAQMFEEQIKHIVREKAKAELGNVEVDGEIDLRSHHLRENVDVAARMKNTDSNFPLMEPKYRREKKTFLGTEKDRQKRDRRWSYTEPGLGQTVHRHQQNWLGGSAGGGSGDNDGRIGGGGSQSLEQNQVQFALPTFHHVDKSPETRKYEDTKMVERHKSYEWTEGTSSSNTEHTRKEYARNATNYGPSMPPEKHPRSAELCLLNGTKDNNGFGERSKDNTRDLMKNKNDFQPDRGAVSEHIRQHSEKLMRSPGNEFRDRYYGQDCLPMEKYLPNIIPEVAGFLQNDVDSKQFKTGRMLRKPSFLGQGNSLQRCTGARANSMDSAYSHIGTDEFYLRQRSQPPALMPIGALESELARAQMENEENHWKRFVPNLPYDFSRSGVAMALGRHSAFPDNFSGGFVSSSMESPNQHSTSSPHVLISQPRLHSLSPKSRRELLQSRRMRWLNGIDAMDKTKKLKLDLPLSTDSPLPSWMNLSTCTTLPSTCIDNFKSFVDHTVQSVFINEMKEMESRQATKNDSKPHVGDVNSDVNGDVNGEFRTSTSSQVAASMTDAPLVDSAFSSASSRDSFPLHPRNSSAEGMLSLSSSSPRPSSSFNTATPDKFNMATPDKSSQNSEPKDPSSLDSGHITVTDGPYTQSNESVTHTKFKKTWLRNYLDQGRGLSPECVLKRRRISESDQEVMSGISEKDDKDDEDKNGSDISAMHRLLDADVNGDNNLSVLVKLDPA